ncbi:GGDEF domain-containing protein [Paenibacillus daejeonensis]|uniref:GGDEF domain-containing protein n=1 Tax=Paenibacillus daejeonensis TaxID=135193 RepID=UPI00036B7495|nr:GGDEF domain-containing protein [Paenibacillus daejeonensis]
MSPSEVWIPIVCYWIPIVFFFYMGMDVYLRNPKKLEHILVSLTILCYLLLFLEEYIRFMLPMSYSPVLASLWFASIGVIIPGLGFHLLARLIGLDKRLPKPWFPYLFHVLLLAIPASLLTRQELISAQEFVVRGVWKWPVANAAYYGTLTASLALSLIPILMLRVVRKRNSHAVYREQNGILRLLEYGSLLTFAWVAIFGYFRFGEVIPPYPYLYAGLIWCFVLRLAMKKYEFLNHAHHRYEKLFQLNPRPILLVSLTGQIKEANPSAEGMFSLMELKGASLEALGGEHLTEKLRQHAELGEFESVLRNGDQSIEALISGDYVTVNHEPHAILLIRDDGARNEYLRKIAFMAYHDPLTELPNRRHFYERLGQAIVDARHTNEELTVMVIDLDDFKQVNDSYGHEAGDQVLRHVSALLRVVAGTSGSAARLGGDEFVLFVPAGQNGDSAAEAVHRLEEAVADNVLVYEGKVLEIKMSVGISRFPRDGADPDELIKHADTTMYQFKQRRKMDVAEG